MNDTQRASKAAEELTEALDSLDNVERCIKNAKELYPDKSISDEIYNRVLHNVALMHGYVRMLRVPAQAWAGDTEGLKATAGHVRTGE